MGLGVTETLGGHKQNLVHTRTQGTGAVTPQETKPDLPVSDWGSPAELWISSGLPQGQVHWQRSPGSRTVAGALLEVANSPTIGTYQPQDCVSLAKQLTGREHSPTHQQTFGLKFFWEQPCPSEQDPVALTASPSHQEDCTCLLSSFRREQKEELRTAIPSISRTNITITESYPEWKEIGLCPRWKNKINLQKNN